MASNDRYGTGFGFPLVADGDFPLVSGEDAVEQALEMLLLTEPGERVRRPEYGCGLQRFLFKPNTVSTRTLMRKTIVEAIERFEPRIELDTVDVTADADDPSLVHVAISYALADDPAPRNMVFPFYLEQES